MPSLPKSPVLLEVDSKVENDRLYNGIRQYALKLAWIPSKQEMRVLDRIIEKTASALAPRLLLSCPNAIYFISGSLARGTAISEPEDNIQSDLDWVICLSRVKPEFSNILDVIENAIFDSQNVFSSCVYLKRNRFRTSFILDDMEVDVQPGVLLDLGICGRRGQSSWLKIDIDKLQTISDLQVRLVYEEMARMNATEEESRSLTSSLALHAAISMRTVPEYIKGIIRIYKRWMKSFDFQVQPQGLCLLIESIVLHCGKGKASSTNTSSVFQDVLDQFKVIDKWYYSSSPLGFYCRSMVPDHIKAQRRLMVNPWNPRENLLNKSGIPECIINEIKMQAANTKIQINKWLNNGGEEKDFKAYLLQKF